jgi:hypothetical protein
MLGLAPEHAPREGEPSPLVTQDAEVARGVRGVGEGGRGWGKMVGVARGVYEVAHLGSK